MNSLQKQLLCSISWGDKKSYSPDTIERWCHFILNEEGVSDTTKDKISEMLFTYFMNTELDPRAKYFIEDKYGVIKLFRDHEYKSAEKELYCIITNEKTKVKTKMLMSNEEVSLLDKVLSEHHIRHLIFKD